MHSIAIDSAMSTVAESFGSATQLLGEHAWHPVQQSTDSNSPVQRHITPGQTHSALQDRVMDKAVVAGNTHTS